MDYGITSNGFVSKPLSVILEEERALFRAAFGNDIDISDASIAGAYIGNQAAKFAQLWELLDGLWSIGDIDSAAGVYLDRLAAFVNVQREAAISTQVTTCMWGVEGTLVYAMTIAKLKTTGELFRLRDNVTIGRNNLLGVWIKVASVEVGAVYSFNIKGVTIQYTAKEGDDEDGIQYSLALELAHALPGLFSQADFGSNGLRINIADGVTPFTFVMNDTKLEIILLGACGVYTAQNAGTVYAPIGTLTEMVSNVDGLDSLYNYATGITGRVVESDTELRANIAERQKQASSNEIAIQNEIQKITGVQYAKVYSNRSMQEYNGRPPKSYESVVVGGDDKIIAETIFNNGPAGVEAFGNTVVQVKDSEGFSWGIGFSRPAPQYIWVKIALSLHSEEQFPVNGNDLIKDNIIAWAAKNMDVGIDLIYQRLSIPIYSVQGIGNAIIKVAKTTDLAPPNENEYHEANIAIGEVEIAVFDRGRIEVEEIVE
jgi:uncharacterized phage protein gp47/JayE